MGKTVLVDAGVLVALISRRDRHHFWATEHAKRLAPPWLSCESVVSEAWFLLNGRGRNALAELLRRGAVRVQFDLATQLEPVLGLLEKYGDVPMSLADACLVRMTELFADSVLITTDSDFSIYRRHSRQVIPSLLP